MTLFLFFLALWIGYLGVEAIRLRRWQETVPLRISVTGTRGKSSVVRMLAAALREDGWTVVGKSTGAEARLILPDGTERPVRRRGRPSILEQVGAVGLASRIGADALVAEVMSVRAENHLVESGRILRPHLVLVTNFRVDHLDAQGCRKEDVARILAADVPGGALALVPEGELEEAFESEVRGRGGRVNVVTDADGPDTGVGEDWGRANRALVRAAGKILELDGAAVERGIRQARQDAGGMRIWRYPHENADSPWLVVNAFAANDPESTFLILDDLLESGSGGGAGSRFIPVGLLCLRGDRGDRTELWARALARGDGARFARIYVHGAHAHALRRRLGRGSGAAVEVLSSGNPAAVMEQILREVGPRWAAGAREERDAAGPGGMVFGFGNFKGLGESMVRHWTSNDPPEWDRPRDVHHDHRPGGSRGL